jgi:hypothetical protein
VDHNMQRGPGRALMIIYIRGPGARQPAPDRAACHPSDLRNSRSPAMAGGQRFRCRIPPTAALIQKRIKRLKPYPNRFVVNHESFLYLSSRRRNPSAEIFRFVYFPTDPY